MKGDSMTICHSERSEDELLRACPKNLKTPTLRIQILPPYGHQDDKTKRKNNNNNIKKENNYE